MEDVLTLFYMLPCCVQKECLATAYKINIRANP